MALMLFGSVAFAEDAKDVQPAPPAPPPKLWESVASADLALTRGNSRSFLGTVTLNTHRKWDSDELLLGGAAGYGNSTTKNSNGEEVSSETQDYLKGFGQFNHLFTERLYAGLRLEGLHDNIADINYRFTVSPLMGYYFIKETNTLLSGEVGPSLITQELAHVRKTYAALRLGERFEHKFDGGAKIWETLEFLPQIDDFSNWILNAEVGVSAPIVKSLDVRLVAQDTYNNHPATDRLKNDLKVLSGIGYRF
jgi:putative salt-induced outer membrane protein YdiY